MAIVRQESRNRVGILWFDNEPEADAFAKRMFETYPPESIEAANVGYVQCGRDPVMDLKDPNGKRIQFAVVTP